MQEKFFKYCIILNSLLLTSLSVLSQSPQLIKVVKPSPNAQSLQKYGDIPVSTYTGIPQIEIPIYTIQSHDITVPISISYHGGGIKVIEEASRVGLGWTLNAGGQISRNIVGQDDFLGTGYFNSVLNDVMDFADGKGIAKNIQSGCLVGIYNKNDLSYPSYFEKDVSSYLNSLPVFEFQPDQYYYNFQGKSGKFIVKRNREVVLQKVEDISINCLDPQGEKWNIISEDGFVFEFSDYETYVDNENSTSGTAQIHKSAWYLTKITSPAGNTVTFEYSNLNNLVRTIGAYSEVREDWTYNKDARPTSKLDWQRTIAPGINYQTKILSTIRFDNGIVRFFYNSNRIDITGDVILEKITVYSLVNQLETKIKSFDFGYSYFESNGFNNSTYFPYSEAAVKRLKLNSLKEYGYYNGKQDSLAPYIFQYNDLFLPAKTSFGRDHWGYYNGKENNSSLIPSFTILSTSDLPIQRLGVMGFERNPNNFFASAFSLSTIKYPTGGISEFQFESNDFDESKSLINDNSFFAKIKMPLEKSRTLIYNSSSQGGQIVSEQIDLTKQYLVEAPINQLLPVKVSVVFRFSSNCSSLQLNQPGLLYFELYNSSGLRVSRVDPSELGLCSQVNQSSSGLCVSCQTNSPVLTYSNSYTLPPDIYTWKAYSSKTGYTINLQDIRVTYTWNETYTSANEKISVGGGLRIKKIISSESFSTNKPIVRTFNYHSFINNPATGAVEEYSNGRRMVAPQYSYFTISQDGYSYIGNGAIACYAFFYKTIHLIRSSDSYLTSGISVGYDKVEEIIGDNGEGGKIITQFKNQPDYLPDYTDSQNFVPAKPPANSTIPFNDNGLLLNQKIYSKSGNYFKLLKETNNEYNVQILSNADNVVYGFENRPMAYNNFGDKCKLVEEIFPISPCYDNLLLSYIVLKSDRSYLNKKTIRVASDLDPNLFVTTNYEYFYDNKKHLLPTRIITSDSKGNKIVNYTKYAPDYDINSNTSGDAGLGIKKLMDKHIVHAPVENYTQKISSDGLQSNFVSAQLMGYSPVSAFLQNISKLDMSAPITTFSPSKILSNSFSSDNRYNQYVHVLSYDSYGNVLEQKKKDNLTYSYLYNYNSNFVVTEIINSNQINTAFTSFEADASGNWDFNTTAKQNVIGGSITGNAAYPLTAGNVQKTGLNAALTYKASCWIKDGSGNILINGAIPHKLLSKKGWTLYQTEVSNATTITISGNGLIDEVRLYPSNAQMSSFTYEPLIGITSKCDVNNRIEYFEYDSFGRLKLIRDFDGNIIKSFDYQYQANQ